MDYTNERLDAIERVLMDVIGSNAHILVGGLEGATAQIGLLREAREGQRTIADAYHAAVHDCSMAVDFDSNIEPCPFCGCAVEYHYEGSGDWSFDCRGCSASTGFWIEGGDEPVRAIAKWNRRCSR